MSRPIVINPAEVVALGERTTHEQRCANPLCPAISDPNYHPAALANIPGLHSNQARLGNGCVCNEGCEACGRLAEAFEAMRQALRLRINEWHGNSHNFMQFEPPSLVASRAALALADKVRP